MVQEKLVDAVSSRLSECSVYLSKSITDLGSRFMAFPLSKKSQSRFDPSPDQILNPFLPSAEASCADQKS